jgi:futalosine hydrolase
VHTIGVGPARAAAATMVALLADGSHGYVAVISAGIAGGFGAAREPGTLVIADRITAADLGADGPDGFLPLDALGWGAVSYPSDQELADRLAAGLPHALRGEVLTVTTATGTAARAAELTNRHPSALAEAMEGYGVAVAAAERGLPVLELRAVSNPVGPRDRAAWRIGDALAALTAAAPALIPLVLYPSRREGP